MSRQTELERLMAIAVAVMPELPEILDAFKRADAVYQETQRVVDATGPQYALTSGSTTDWVRA